MAHGHNAVHRTEIPSSVEDRIEKRNQRGDPFQRKSLGAQITRLQNLLEEVGANQPVENFFLVDFYFRTLNALCNPLPPLRFGQVHEFHANVAAVDAARFLGGLAA